jgi:signal transduction histidine kinase
VVTGNVTIGSCDPPARHDGRFAGLDRISLLRRHRRMRGAMLDAVAVIVAVLDVWLVIPEKAETYSVVLSGVACAAMVLHRHIPFVAVLITVPGFMAGWAQLAAMIALGALARRKQWTWQTMVGAGLVMSCRYMVWPVEDYLAQNWREHVLNVIYGVIVAGMPVALGLLVAVRNQLAQRLRELAESRERERQLHEETIRAAERANLAREMHDLVSHQVTLIAMQAGALVMSTQDDKSRDTAQTIRQLSTRTLDELRDLVSVLRSGGTENSQPGLEALDALVRDSSERVHLALREIPARLPAPISRAAYRTVQEALTNVRKHAPGANVVIRVHAEGESLIVEVHNDSTSGPVPMWTPQAGAEYAQRLPSGGHGLVGLRERAGMLDGTFEAGHTADGGFLVRASYPLTISAHTGVRIGF